MTYPGSQYQFNTFEEALDDLIADWLEDEDEADIVAALLAKVDEMKIAPEIAVDETKVDDAAGS
jgi:hypothetical protein